MSAEAEFNVLANLFQTVAHDLKASSSAFDSVCSRATKLANQLNATVNCLSSFIDSVQIISDYANNIKGSSRDIGASLTRFCMRQRSLESLIRSLASALSEQFAGSMDKKGIEWKQRVQEIERRHAKTFKKTRSRKPNLEADCIQEQRNSAAEILFEQRNQFVYFVNALLPVMNMEVNLLDEGTHVRQVRDAIEATVNESDSQQIIQTLMEDLCHNGESSWHKRMASPTRSAKSTISSATGSHMRPSSPSQISSTDWSGIDTTSRVYASISSAPAENHYRRMQITSQTYIPPSSVNSVTSGSNSVSTLPSPTSPTSKPPLPIGSRRAYTANSATQPFPNMNLANPLSMSANDISEPMRRSQRPVSFSGDPSDFLMHESNLENADRNHTSRTSAALIAETIDQIDRLGIELDSYCRTLKPVENSSGLGSSVASSADMQNGYASSFGSGQAPGSPTKVSSGVPTPIAGPGGHMGQNGVLATSGTGPSPFPTSLPVGLRFRPDSIRPPPPERRNSTITAATPNAPSIADLRQHSSRMGSTQDLPNQTSHYATYYHQPYPTHQPQAHQPQHGHQIHQKVSTPAIQESRTFGYKTMNGQNDSMPPPLAQVLMSQGYRPPPPSYQNYRGRFQ